MPARPNSVIELGRVGFRTLESPADVARAGIALEVNGVSVFARGAVWTPDLLHPHAAPAELRVRLQAMRDAGMNMVRIPGIACYETDAFHDLCDELGILVWQDFMFANLDYPDRDPGFMDAVRAEAAAQLRGLGRHPSLAVLCGGSEVAQQAAMMGVDPLPAMAPLYLEALPEAIAQADIDVPYVPSTPWGGDQPFRPSRGVANYYGVGAYLRPLADARAAQVRFAAECLAFANVPDAEAVAELTAAGGPAVHHPAWKRGVPRDVGAGWDFEDVRDHYLALLYGVDPVTLRSSDPERYLDLSRQVSGEVMAEVMGEWRRAGLTLRRRTRAVVARSGAGRRLGRARPPRACPRSPITTCAARWRRWRCGAPTRDSTASSPTSPTTDPRVSRWRCGSPSTAIARRSSTRSSRELCLAPHTTEAHNVEGLLGPLRRRRLGLPLRAAGPGPDRPDASRTAGRPEPRMLSQSFRHPAGRPTTLETAAGLGLRATLREAGAGRARARASPAAATRTACACTSTVTGPTTTPSRSSRVASARSGWPPRMREAGPPRGHVSALNLRGTRGRGTMSAWRRPRPRTSVALRRMPFCIAPRPPRTVASPCSCARPSGGRRCAPIAAAGRGRRRSPRRATPARASTCRAPATAPAAPRRARCRRGRAPWPTPRTWLAQSTGAGRVVALGLGLGGFVAALAAQDGAAIDDLLLWGVPRTGKALLRAARAYAAVVAARYPEDARVGEPAEGELDLIGFRLPAATVRALAVAALRTRAAGAREDPRRALLIGRDGAGPDAQFSRRLRAAGVQVTEADGEEYGLLLGHPQAAVAPAATIARSLGVAE